MTEEEWLGWLDPEHLMFELERLVHPGVTKLSLRRLWLYMAACVRRAWHLLPNERFRDAVFTAERFADGRAEPGEFDRMANQVSNLAGEEESRGSLSEPFGKAWSPACAMQAVAFLASDLPMGWDARTAAGWVVDAVADRQWLAEPDGQERWEKTKREEQSAQAQLLRDIFGNPFRPVAVSPGWLTSTVTTLAQAAYDKRHLPCGSLDSLQLAVLADAFEEAGCTEQAILDHLRAPCLHVRGCWPVDLALAKE